MRTARSCTVLLSFLLSTGLARAASPRDTMVVSSAWLAQHLNDPNLVLLHVGDKAQYPARHIPGARYVDFGTDLAISDHSGKGLMLEMLPADVLRDRLAALGISDDSRIVVYYGQDWISPSTRVIFTLDYAGLGKSSSLLDGGMEAWVRDGHAVTDAVPEPKTGKLSALALKPLVVDAKYVFEHLKAPHVAVVDGRAASFYDGVDTGQSHDYVHRTGHIAGAHNVPFDSIVDEHSMLRSPEELAALFTKAGVQPDDTIIGYCHLGQQATAMLFAARSLGHPVMLYDGSFEDWSRHTDYPVDNPAAKDAKKGQ